MASNFHQIIIPTSLKNNIKKRNSLDFILSPPCFLMMWQSQPSETFSHYFILVNQVIPCLVCMLYFKLHLTTLTYIYSVDFKTRFRIYYIYQTCIHSPCTPHLNYDMVAHWRQHVCASNAHVWVQWCVTALCCYTGRGQRWRVGLSHRRAEFGCIALCFFTCVSS